MSSGSLLTVLVVDDDADVRLLLKLALEDADYTVMVAVGGGEALEYLATGTADIMLTDLQMPVMTGVELFAESRARLTPAGRLHERRDKRSRNGGRVWSGRLPGEALRHR